MKQKFVFVLFAFFLAVPLFADIAFGTVSYNHSWWELFWEKDRTTNVTVYVFGDNVYQSSGSTAWYNAPSVTVGFYSSVTGDYTQDGRIIEYVGNGWTHYAYDDDTWNYATFAGSYGVSVTCQYQDSSWHSMGGASYSIRQDLIAPTVTASPNTYQWQGTPLEVDFSGSQPVGPGIKTYTVTRLAGSYVDGSQILSNSAIAVSSKNGQLYFLAPSSGTYKIQAIDQCNLASDPVFAYVNDVTPPKITVSGAPQSGVAHSATVTATATEISGDTGIMSFISTTRSKTHATDPFSDPITNQSPGSQVFSNTGLYELQYSATDWLTSAPHTTLYPQSGQAPITFEILAQGPHITFPVPQTSGWFNQDWFSENPQGIVISFNDDFGTALEGSWQEPGVSTTEWHTGGSLSSLGEGIHTIAAKATDVVDQTSFGNDTLSIDTTPPVLSISYNYGPGTSATVLADGHTYYIRSGAVFADNSSDVTSGYAPDSAKIAPTGVPGSTAVTIFSLTSIGSNSYTVWTKDIAGNTSSIVVTLVYDPDPIEIGAESTNIQFLNKSNNLTPTPLTSGTPINADNLQFYFEQSVYGFAMPSTLSFRYENEGSYRTPALGFAGDGIGNYASGLIPLNNPDGTPLTDGLHTLSYLLTDAAGNTTPGSIAFTIHRRAPQAVQSGNIIRYSKTPPAPESGRSVIWQQAASASAFSDRNVTWTISAADAGLISSASGWDGISFTYAEEGGFDTTGYSYRMVDGQDTYSISAESAWTSQAANGVFSFDGTSFTYQFHWGSESGRTLTLSVINEAGGATSSTVALAKPVSGNLTGPIKISGNRTFSLRWTDSGAAIDGGTKGVRWGDGLSHLTALSQPGGSLLLQAQPSQFDVGGSFQYEEVVDLAEGNDHAIEVQQDAATAYIPYEVLTAPTLPSQRVFLGAGAASEVDLTLDTTAEDGINVQYALEIDVLDATGYRVRYFPYSSQTGASGGFAYDLWALFPSLTEGADTSSLNAALGAASALTAKIVAWYGSPLSGPSSSLPTVATGAFYIPQGSVLGSPPSAAESVSLSASWQFPNIDYDVIAPSLILSAGTNAFTSIQPLIKGTAADNAAGSGLSRVMVDWASESASTDGSGNIVLVPSTYSTPQAAGLDGAGGFSYQMSGLADGAYSVQVTAIDRAGNTWSPSPFSTLVDTQALVLVADTFQLAAGGTDASGNVLAGSDGTILGSFRTNDGGGSGLAAVLYQWEDAQGHTLGAGWTQAILSPRPGTGFDGFHGSAEAYTARFGNAVNGVAILHIRLVDKAGNTTGDLTGTGSAWGVDYANSAPTVNLVVSGWRTTTGGNWIRGATELAVGWAPVDEGSQNAVASVRWNVQRVKEDGTYQDNSSSWSAWGASFEAVRGLISTNGQSYRIQLQVQNANGVRGSVVSSMVFTQDGLGPQNVSASLTGATSVVVGQAIGASVSATDSYGTLSWTWSYRAGSGAAVVQSYIAGSDIVIPSAGTYSVSFTVSSGSGISVSFPIASSVVVIGTGLAVNDNQKFNNGSGAISGRWSYAGGTPALYSYRWIRTSDNAVLQDWRAGDATNSSVLVLTGTGMSLQAGDVVALEVKAMDGSGNVLDDRMSAGSTVDTTSPQVSLSAAPAYVSTSDVWLSFSGADAESGILSGTALVKKLSANADGSFTWKAVTHQSLSSLASAGQRLDLDLSGTGGVSTGDRIVAEISLENGAGLTTTVESGVMIVDGSAPPAPVVMSMVQVGTDSAGKPVMVGVLAAVNNSRQSLGLDWSFTSPDPESGTVRYYWMAYASAAELASKEAANSWTSVADGQSAATGLSYGLNAPYSDGTVLYFAVMAVNGAGLQSIGYSSGVILDSTAPVINALVGNFQNGSQYVPLGSYVRQSDLAGKQVFAQFNATDAQSGLNGFMVQAGTWSAGTGFSALPDQPTDFAATQSSENPQYYFTRPGVPFTANVAGTIGMLQGKAFDQAGNVTVFASVGFQVVGDNPQITALAGNLSRNSLSFTWNTDSDTSFLKGFQITLSRSDGANSTTSTITAKAWTVDWTALGFRTGDQIQFSVTPVTALGLAVGRTINMTIQPSPPTLVPSGFIYTRYFSDHFNVGQVAYEAPVGIGIEQIQWRLRDGTSGQLIQDWRPDYSGASTSWNDPQTDSFRALILDPAKVPVDGQKLLLEIRAESQMGIWSELTPSQVILVDQTPATGVSITRASAYSNATNNTGAIDGWTVSGQDTQSGLMAYQTILSTTADPAGLNWGSASIPVGTGPGTAWSAKDISIPGSTAQTRYYAFLRLQNGTGDWGAPIESDAISVSWTAPVLRMLFAPSVTTRRDASGNAVTNEEAETLTLTSNEPGTAFVLSVNSLLYGNQPVTQEGMPAGGSDGAVQSYGTVVVNGPGFDVVSTALAVTATDLFGNQTTVSDALRFNLAPAVEILRTHTTPGQPLDLEKLVGVVDDYRDYPLSYSWSLGGGTLLSGTGQGTAGFTDNGQLEAPWQPSATTMGQYFQNGRSQLTTYALSLTVTDSWGKTLVQPITIEVDNTTSGALFTNEYWTGAVVLSGMVEVPSGLKLTLDSVQGTASGALDQNLVMIGGIMVDGGGSLVVSNSAGMTKFDTDLAGYTWKGFFLAGSATGDGLEIDHAERGVAVGSSGSLVFSNLNLEENLIGVHLLGGSVRLDGGTVSGNSEYGIKEDALGSFIVKNMIFLNNGIGYYQLGKTGISITELNAIAGNGGNR